jgi:large repetitive protein
MKKTFSCARRLQPVERKHQCKNQERGRGCPRLHWLVLCAFLGVASFVCGQDGKLGSGPKPAAREERERRTLREQWFLRGRSSPAQSGAAQRYRAYLQKMRMRAERVARMQSSSSPASALVWTLLGPAPMASDASGGGQEDYGWVSGRATAVAIDPADSTGNTVYIGGAYGGVWKSTNAGPASPSPANVVWQALTDNQATLAVGAIAIQPGNTNANNSVIVVGTGEANSSADSYYGLGILRSLDAGINWTLISSDTTGTRSFAGMAFSRIAFSTNPASVAVAATAGASEGIIEGLENPLTANLGLYYSSDSGNSWTYATVSDGGVATAPGSATSVVYNASAGQFFAALRYHGFYSSPDSIHWTRLNTQPGGGLTTTACPANPSSSSCPIYRGEIAVVPGRNEMYVWFVDANDFDQGIWTSLDGGNTWNQIDDAGIINCGDPLGCGTEQGSYNLELAAVPNGNSGVTDLYAGAINLYKCEIIGSSPSCNGTGSNTFLNLTHAYGCSSIAMVHPAQHAVAFLVNTSTQDVMYFANDGGIYRALNGYSLLTGTCGGTNPFDSLNGTMGSMTQFVSFAQASGDLDTILGGTQGNGSPGTQSAVASSPVWQSVNFGDGGYTQISPDNELLWFVSSPPDSISGVNIFSCASGINCDTQNFQNSQVVSSESVGGDAGAYYPPYILDPQNAGEIVVGTCRMWRGSSAGGAFTVLSPSFETGGDGICTGGEINLVRSLAAGGALGGDGFSNVIYAGTDGFGPLIPTVPPGGHVWVSTNVAGGTSTWVDQTGSINPNSFPISGIAMDRSDKQGLTAYVSIMGFSTTSFSTSHVWQTTNGGISWTDFTANLPDAPANAVLVDPGSVPTNGTVYVGTDVGVFSSSTAAPNWTEVGPAPNSGQAGFLPNVAVTALGMFIDSAGSKWLRASTYGRGMWQILLTTFPDFSLSVSNTPLTVFFSQQPAQFNGTIVGLDGYSSLVILSCTPGSTAPPPTCSVAPGSVMPTAAGAPFAVTASGTPQTYSFYVHAVGTDPDGITHDSPVTLNVIDFALTAPSPASVTVGPSSVSGPVSFQVTAQGSFDDTVNLSCGNLPSGATCNFLPSSSVNPTSTSPVAITLTVSASANAAAGTFPTTINGSVTNGPTKTQSLSLTITLDYSLGISNPALQADVNAAPVFYNGTLTSLNGYTSPVVLGCGAGATAPPSTCSALPTPLVPTTSGAPFTVAVASAQCSPPGTPPHTPFSFNIVAQGTDSAKTSHTFPVTFTATAHSQDDFTLELTPPSNTAATGAPAQFNGSLMGTVCYNYPVHLSCGSNAPPTCQFSPATIVPSVTGTPFGLTVSSNRPAIYSFEVAAVGSDPNATTHSFLLGFTSTGGGSGPTFSFTITPNPGTESVPAGQPAIYDLDVAPSGGTFPGNVALSSSSNCPTLSTCTLSASQVSKGSGDTHLTFTITTTAPVIAVAHPGTALRPLIYALCLSLPGLIIVGGTRRHRKRFVFFLLLALIVPVLSLEIACSSGLQGNGTGGNGQSGTPTGTYTVTVSGTLSGFPEQSAQVQLTVN